MSYVVLTYDPAYDGVMSAHGPFGSTRMANDYVVSLAQQGIIADVLPLVPVPSCEISKNSGSVHVVPGPPGFSCEDVYPDA